MPRFELSRREMTRRRRRRRVRAGGAPGVGGDDHDRRRRAGRRRRSRSRPRRRPIPAIARSPPSARARRRSCWWCTRSSACTNTSRTSAAGWPSWAPRRRARAVRAPGRRLEDRRPQGDLGKVVSKVPDAQVMSDLDATVAWAKARAAATRAASAITGFCWGGRIAWLYAAHSTALKAGVAWYGRLVGDKDPLRPRHPIDVARRAEGAGAGPVRRAGPGHPGRHRRGDAQGARGGRRRGEAIADPGLSGRGPRVLRRLPPELRPPTPPTAGPACSRGSRPTA